MKSHIIHDSQPVILFGGGNYGESDFEDVRPFGDVIVAADGGALFALEHGRVPAAVIGDFDSLPESTRARIPAHRLHQIDEQETTDFEKCLSHIKAPLVLGIGFSGARLDHELAALSALLKYPAQRCILVGQSMVTVLAPPQISVALEEGDLVSLFPLREVTGTSQGLVWPIDGLRLQPFGRIGTSNRALGRIELKFDTPHMLLMLPRARLGRLVEALLSAKTGW